MLARYNIQLGVPDAFGAEGRRRMGMRLEELPDYTRQSVELELATEDFLELQIEDVEKRLERMMQNSAEADLLRTLPYVGPILSTVMALEIGRMERFPSAAHLASYAGLVPRVHSSGGHTRLGQICGDINRYLKWAFVEAGNLVVIHQRHLAGTHVVRLYQRVKRKKNHQKAVGAVARHLAEAAYWILKKQEVYRDPLPKRNVQATMANTLSSTQGKRGTGHSPLRLTDDCDTRSRDWLLQKLKADSWLPAIERN